MGSILRLVVFGIIISILSSWATRPEADSAEATVLQTSVYTLSGGAITNSLCAIVVRHVGAVEPGEEMGACSPYGLIGAAITVRLHLYWINGYGPDEWAYVRGVPARSVAYVKHGAETLLGFGPESQAAGDVVEEQSREL